MTVGEIIDELTKMLGNRLADASHVFVSPVDMRYRWVTRAANKIPRLAAAGGYDILSTFEELYDQWQATTAIGIPYLDLPNNALLIRQLDSFDLTPATAFVDPVRLVSRKTPMEYDRAVVSSESPAFPVRWTRKGIRIFIGPVPDATHVTDLLLTGIKKEIDFNDPAQTPMLKDDWHEAIMLEAAAIGAKELGWFDRAKEYRAEVALLVQTGTQVPTQEGLLDGDQIELEGLLDYEEVYL